MRKDYQKFICEHCGRTFITNIDDSEYNCNELEAFDVTDEFDSTKEFCSEECMMKGLQFVIIKNKSLGRRIDLRIESYKYEYEYEGVAVNEND